MKQSFKVIIFCSVLSLVLTGCIVRAYKQVKVREDQVVSGNRGFIQGALPPAAQTSPKTRETYVVEIEMKSPIKFEVGKPPEIKPVEENIGRGNRGYLTGGPEEEEQEETSVSTEQESVKAKSVTRYTVKKDDTLQKISQQFFGTVKKWNKIYQANKDKIKDPNRIKPGVVLDIPQE